MTYVQKARLTYLGINDELKDDASSVYTTDISSSLFHVPAAFAASAVPTYEGHGVKAVTLNEQDFH